MLRKIAYFPAKIGRLKICLNVKCFVKGMILFMSLGNKISDLRKKENLSQEKLAEKLGVTRQTISKWELGETAPDILQAKELAKIFNVSLDELTDNDIKNVLEAKVSNTEKLAGMIIKILKVIGIMAIIYLVLMIIGIVLFMAFPEEHSNADVKTISATLDCSLEGKDYTISIGEGNYFDCPNCSKEMNVYLKDITDWANIDHSIENINKYFEDNGGTCE